MASEQSTSVQSENGDITKSTKFWNSVSKIYENSELTKHNSDSELDFVFMVLDQLENIEKIVCFGVADGCRDPGRMLEHMVNKKMNLPRAMILNDLSPKLLNVCKKRLKHYNIPTVYHDGPMNEMTCWLPKTRTNPWYILGVYNAKYIKESLEMYKKNQKVIGTHFKLTTLLYLGKLEQGSVMLEFDINNFMDHIDKIINLSKSEKSFIGFSIKTNTGFITHYYTQKGLSSITKNVFGGCDTMTFEAGDRYVISLVKKNKEKPDCLITTLNNMMGNIPFDMQLESIGAIASNFFN